MGGAGGLGLWRGADGDWRPAAGWVVVGGWGGQGKSVTWEVEFRFREGMEQREGKAGGWLGAWCEGIRERRM